jgi:PKD repeat protein
VTDSHGAASTDTATVSITNLPPLVDAGADRTETVGVTIDFQGTASDAGAQPLASIVWDFGDGTPTASGSLSVSHTFAATGVYTVTLTVRDSAGAQTADSLQVTVNPPPNHTPVADAGGPYSVAEGARVAVSASGSTDPDLPDDTLTYQWDLDGDGQYDDASGVDAEFSAAGLTGPSTVVIGLRVTDTLGAESTDTAEISITNLPPMVDAGSDRTETAGVSLNFQGTASDAGAQALASIVWNFGDGTPVASGSLSVSHAFAATGVYTVTLTVLDSGGALAADSLQVTVNLPPNHTPAADAGGPYSVAEGARVAVSASGSTDPDLPSDTLTYQWDLDGDGQYDDATGVDAEFSAAGLTGPSTAVIGLCVTDSRGAESTDTAEVSITNLPPTVDAGADCTEMAGISLSFQGTASDAGAQPLAAINWNFGDGTPTASGSLVVSHAFAIAGDYTVTLTVRDSGGAETADSLQVTVFDQPVVQFADARTTLAGDAETSKAWKAADIVLGSPLGDNRHLTLSGADAGMFEVVGQSLYLKAGSDLQPLTHPHLNVTVDLDDVRTALDPDATASLEIAVTDPAQAVLDVDANGRVDPMNDGMLLIRYYFEFRGNSLVSGMLGSDSTRTSADRITTYLESACPGMLDVDGNGEREPLTDGLLVLRYLFDFRGSSLTASTLGPGATRNTPESIVAFLDGFFVNPGNAKSQPPAKHADVPNPAAYDLAHASADAGLISIPGRGDLDSNHRRLRRR